MRDKAKHHSNTSQRQQQQQKAVRTVRSTGWGGKESQNMESLLGLTAGFRYIYISKASDMLTSI